MNCFKHLNIDEMADSYFEVFYNSLVSSLSCEKTHYLLIKNRVGQHFLYEIPKLKFILNDENDLQAKLEDAGVPINLSENNNRYVGHSDGLEVSKLGPGLFSRDSAWEGPGTIFYHEVTDGEINQGQFAVVLFTGNCAFYVGHRSDFEDFGVAPTQLKEIFKLLYESLKSGKSLDLSAKKQLE